MKKTALAVKAGGLLAAETANAVFFGAAMP